MQLLLARLDSNVILAVKLRVCLAGFSSDLGRGRARYLTFRALLLLFALPVVLLSQGDNDFPHDAALLRMSREARAPAAKGTHIPIPSALLEKVQAAPGECPTDSPEELSKERIRLDAYRVPLRKGVIGVVVWRRSSCYRSPTGNCVFWIFRQGPKGYELLLETDMARDFGFLSSSTSGYRDLIVVSHGSATDSGYRIFWFEDGTYQNYCSWDEVYDPESEHPEKLIGPRVEANHCAALSKSRH